MVIEGIDRYRVIEPCFEGVRVILSHRGERYSPAYIQGISGAAFRVAGICPCAPTCSTAMWTTGLVERLGYEHSDHMLSGEGIDPAEHVHEVVDRVKGEIRSGRPALVWHAFTNAEWDVVCGFDEEDKKLWGRGSYLGVDGYASADEMRMAKAVEICTAYGAVLIGEKVREFDARAAEIAALAEAVRHARSTWNQDKLGGEEWTMLEGLLCYDRWVHEFESDPTRARGVGDSYCLGVYHSTHRAASYFLHEIASEYPEAAAQLERAAGHFAAEADALDECLPLLWWESPVGPDAERNAKAATVLGRARDSYARAVDEIEAALAAIA